MVMHQQETLLHILEKIFHQYNSYSRRNPQETEGPCRNKSKWNQEPYHLYKPYTLEQFFLLYHYIQIQSTTFQGDDNEDPYMDKDTEKDNRQPPKNQNKHHDFDKVVKHIEIQLKILMYLLKQYKWLQIKILFSFFHLLVLFIYPPISYDTSVPDGHICLMPLLRWVQYAEPEKLCNALTSSTMFCL